MSSVFDIEYTALKMLARAEEKVRDDGKILCLTGLNPGVLVLVRRSPLDAALGQERMLVDLEQAVERYRGTTIGKERQTPEPGKANSF
jgi:sulfate permease, SulP family